MGQTVVTGVVFFFVFAAFYVLQGLASVLMGPALASNALSTLYGVFTAACLFAPYVVNRYGAKWSLRIGILGYCSLSISTLLVSLYGTRWFVILCGALNGLGAAVLWTSQGRFLLECAAADTSRDVSEHFSIFWGFFNASAVFGGIATFLYFGDAETSNGNFSVLFAAFVILMALGAAFTVFLTDDVGDTAESSVGSPPMLSARVEIVETAKLLLTRRALLLGPLYWYTGFNQPYQIDNFGDRTFSPKVVGLELALFYLLSVVAAKVAEHVLVPGHLRQKLNNHRNAAVRALLWFCGTSVLAFTLAATVVFKKQESSSATLVLATFAFGLWGFSSSIAQAFCYWLIDVLYDQTGPDRARAVALYKLLQSLGWCVGFALLPVNRCPNTGQFLLNALSCFLAFFLALFELPTNDSRGTKNGYSTPLLVQEDHQHREYSSNDGDLDSAVDTEK